ncbi:MAG: NAD(P)H-dependent oxidoreductase [Flammeovirgaceae bacterium]
MASTSANKKILLIQGHPNLESFNFALHQAYKEGAIASGAEVRELILAQMDFSLNLAQGYQKRSALEPDLIKAQDDIEWADHLVIFHPVWWGSVPALLKGFIDRVFLPGFAFKYRENSLWWDKLLTGRSARIVSTLDQPAWYYRLRYSRPSYHSLKQLTLQFSGFSPVRTSTIGPIKNSSEKFRTSWLQKVKKLGMQ